MFAYRLAEHALRRWSAGYLRAMGRLKNPRVGSHLKNLLEAAGFVEVEIYSFNLPMCGWSDGMSSSYYDVICI